MVKKILGFLFLFSMLFWSCATYQPPPPSFHVGSLPLVMVTGLSLDERILVEDAWKSIRQGNANKARKNLEKLGAENPFYLVGMGYVAYILQDLPSAENTFKAALAKHPDMVLTHMGLAQLYMDTNRKEQAFVEFREILKREPDQGWAKQNYESIRKAQTDEALFDGKTFLAEGDIEQSKASYLKALFYSPLSMEAHLALANIYKEENQLQNALIHLKTAVSNDPQNKKILNEYGDILFLAGDYKKSLEVYERLQNRDPRDANIKERIETIKNRLGIFELPSQYESIPATEAVSKEEVAALIGVKFKNVLEEHTRKPPIIIDIATSWAANFILKLTSIGILDVYPNHTFQPKKIVTKAEMAEILLRLIDSLKKRGFKFIQQIPLEKIQVPDVSSDNYYYQPILHLLSYDIMSLSQDKTFGPELPVSGSESIKFLNLILALIK